MEIGTEAAQFPEMEYFNGIFVAVLGSIDLAQPRLPRSTNLFKGLVSSDRIVELFLRKMGPDSRPY